MAVLRDGEPLPERLARMRLSDTDLRQAVREHGYGSYEDIGLVLLEPNGRFSVIPRERLGKRRALADLEI